MGLPKLVVEFLKRATTAIARSEKGVVAIILRDATKEDTTYVYQNEDSIVKSHWSADSLGYLNQIFKGNPLRVLVERIGTEETYDDALGRLANKKWDYLCIPGLTTAEVAAISDWIIAKRAAKKTFKAILPHSVSNNPGIINFDTDGIKVGNKTYTAAQYCPRIAGLLAGTGLDASATGAVLAEVDAITESLTPDADVDAGKLILVNDGETVEIARAVNSLVTLGTNDTEDMKSIKIIEGMDLIANDIRESFKQNYVGRSNSLELKERFVAAVNQYFVGLQGTVLNDAYDNHAEIDVDAQRAYLAQSRDVSELTDAEIKQQSTGTYMFMRADIDLLDAAEDLKFTIYI